MIDVPLVLTKLSDMGLVRLNRPIGRYYSIYCPIHKGGKEQKPSCGVLLQDEVRNGKITRAGWVHCFTCGHSKSLPDTISDILKARAISLSGLDWLKEQIPGFSIDSEDFDFLLPKNISEQLTNQYALEYTKLRTNVYQRPFVSEDELVQYRFTVDYMYQRGLTDELINLFDVGFDANFKPQGFKNAVPCITFPVRDSQGNTLFICRRAIETKMFNLPKDVEKPLYGIYELPKNSKIVVIAESCFNVLTCYRYGVPAVGLLGTGTPLQISQLKRLGVSEFVIGTDPDEAGDRAAQKLKNELKHVAIVRRMNDIPPGKDINDLTEDEFHQIFNNRL